MGTEQPDFQRDIDRVQADMSNIDAINLCGDEGDNEIGKSLQPEVEELCKKVVKMNVSDVDDNDGEKASDISKFNKLNGLNEFNGFNGFGGSGGSCRVDTSLVESCTCHIFQPFLTTSGVNEPSTTKLKLELVKHTRARSPAQARHEPQFQAQARAREISESLELDNRAWVLAQTANRNDRNAISPAIMMQARCLG
ncbi:hypothetical protein LXL04_016101 [Taraxacum kok-saghyz]